MIIPALSFPPLLPETREARNVAPVLFWDLTPKFSSEPSAEF